MNKLMVTISGRLPLMAVFSILLYGCNNDDTTIYSKIRGHADNIKVINTHEHQHLPSETGSSNFGFFHLIATSYLAADLSSAGLPGNDPGSLDSLSLDKAWDIYGNALDFTRNTSYYSQMVKGFGKLYDFKDTFFTKDNTKSLSQKVEENYKNYDAWFDSACKKAGFELMFIDQYWKPLNTRIDTNHYALAVNINTLVESSSMKPAAGEEPNSVYRMAADEGTRINNLNDYLSFCDNFLRKNLEAKAICIKNSQAYSRTLFYENVPFEEAELLYIKPSADLSPVEAKKIQDFMFHWLVRKATEYDLPVQIHTGYLAGNGNVLDNGQPVKLNNLFLLYPNTKFVIFHGGFPWTGECAALAKMFPNVYLDLVWLPQISREEAVHALDVMLDCVPYNKFFWGGDCRLIEESVGSAEFAKDVVSETLANRIKRGLLTENVAMDIVDRIFRENAIEVFRLKEKLKFENDK